MPKIDIPSALEYREADVLRLYALNGQVLEVGALLGHSTVTLAQVADRVVSVDPHVGYPEADPRPTLGPFLANLERYGVRDKVVPCVGRDDEVLPFLRPKSFDLAFVDTTGKYSDTLRAALGCLPLLRDRGVLAIHDCGHPDWPGAIKAADRLVLVTGVKYELVNRLAVFNL